MSLQSIVSGKIVSIEGNIGVGKTSLLSRFNEMKYEGMKLIASLEKVPQAPLEMYTKSPKAHAAAFQTACLYDTKQRISKVSSSLAKDGHSIAFIDRGLDGNAIFAEVNCEHNNMSAAEYSFYRLLLKETRGNCQDADLVVFLDCSPDRIQHRLKKDKRRVAEKHYVSQYFKDLDLAHVQRACELYNEGRALALAYENFLDVEDALKIITTVMKARALNYLWPEVVRRPWDGAGRLVSVVSSKWTVSDVVSAWEEDAVCLDSVEIYYRDDDMDVRRDIMRCLMMRLNVFLIDEGSQ